jgi:hypothetical protein
MNCINVDDDPVGSTLRILKILPPSLLNFLILSQPEIS